MFGVSHCILKICPGMFTKVLFYFFLCSKTVRNGDKVPGETLTRTATWRPFKPFDLTVRGARVCSQLLLHDISAQK